MNKPPFKNRYSFEGTLTTTSPLHIGDGEAAWIGDRSRPKNKAAGESDASTVCTDYRDRAYIPGSAIKGAVRSWLRANGQLKPGSVWIPLLGSENPDAPDAEGGKLTFFDAFHVSGSGPDTQDKALGRPWWSPTRRTAVAVCNSLDRRTRTSKDKLLYHIEYVPPGEMFGVEVFGENLTPDEHAAVCQLMSGWSKTLRLGALESDTWGTLVFSPGAIRATTNLNQATPADETFPALGTTPQSAQQLSFHIQVSFREPWLVRDPRPAPKNKKTAQGRSGEPDFFPLENVDGRPVVPAKSFRGALVSQAEKILRTLAIPTRDHPSQVKTVQSLRDVQGLDLASKLFGCSGWRSPVEVSSLELPMGEHCCPIPQEFNAIDRFTGGGADGAKFDGRLASAARVEGDLIINLTRLRLADGSGATLGLLALLFRDLEEGDVRIGATSSKGVGECEVKITLNDGRPWREDPDMKAGHVALKEMRK